MGVIGWEERAHRVLAGGPGTFSKHWRRYPERVAPTAIVAGEGAYVTGDNGQTYLDTVGALGTNLFGYGHPVITEAVIAQLRRGTSFSMMHPLEVEVAEQLVRLLPNVDQCRFMRNGSDATGAAVRLARAITGKRHVICCGYHGASSNDWYASTTTQNAGVLAENAHYAHQIAFGDYRAFPYDMLTDLAAFILEVPPFLWDGLGMATQEQRDALTWYRALAACSGAVFILDEVITMLRYGLAGAQGMYSLDADLITGGKALANGLPLAVLGGRAEYMQRFNEGDLFCSYTFAGEATALAAAQAVLTLLEEQPGLLVHLRHVGHRLGNHLASCFAKHHLPVTLWGNYARLSVRWKAVPGVATAEELRTLWLAEHARRGVLHGIGVIFPQVIWEMPELATLMTAADEVSGLMAHAIQTDTVRSLLPCSVITDVLRLREESA